MAHGDELWESGATDYAAPVEGATDEIAGFLRGFAVIYDDEILEWNDAPSWIV